MKRKVLNTPYIQPVEPVKVIPIPTDEDNTIYLRRIDSIPEILKKMIKKRNKVPKYYKKRVKNIAKLWSSK
jgi:hypothetical protein